MKRIIDLKLQTKFLLAFIAIIFFTVLMISLVSFNISKTTLKDYSSKYSEYLMEQLSINLESTTKDMEDYIFVQFNNSALNKYLKVKESNEINGYFKKRSVDSFFYNLMNSKPYIKSVYIIDKYGYKYFKSKNEDNGEAEKNSNALDIDKVKKLWGQTNWRYGDNGTVYMERAIFDSEDTKYLGIIVVGIKSEYLKNLYQNIDKVVGGRIVILDKQNNIMVTGDDVTINIIKYIAAYSLYDKFKNGLLSFIYEGDEYISTIQLSPNKKWKVQSIITVKELNKSSNTLKFWIFVTCLAAFLCAMIMALLISKNITEGIRLLIKNIKKFAEGNFDTKINPKSHDEIGILTLEFNAMAEKIDNLINSVYNEKLLKKNAQYKALQFEYNALQAQINPHFLYNTLETINSMAKIRGQEEISEMIYLLGNIFRETISRKSNIVLLRDELQYIKYYLEIQKRTYRDKFEVEYDIDDELMDAHVPKFILQPVVENAIIHGIQEKVGIGIILINGYKSGQNIIIEVIDNGVGIGQQELSNLLRHSEVDKAENTDSSHTKIGVKSVDKRIKILFGETYGLRILSSLGTGTKVEIVMPMVNAGEIEIFKREEENYIETQSYSN